MTGGVCECLYLWGRNFPLTKQGHWRTHLLSRLYAQIDLIKKQNFSGSFDKCSFCFETLITLFEDTDSAPRSELLVVIISRTACSHWDVRWTQTLVSGKSCPVRLSVCVCVEVYAQLHQHAYACTVIAQGWTGFCCMLSQLEGYVNALREECEYTSPLHINNSHPRLPSFSPCLHYSLCPPHPFLPLCKHTTHPWNSYKMSPLVQGWKVALYLNI